MARQTVGKLERAGNIRFEWWTSPETWEREKVCSEASVLAYKMARATPRPGRIIRPEGAYIPPDETTRHSALPGRRSLNGL